MGRADQTEIRLRKAKVRTELERAARVPGEVGRTTRPLSDLPNDRLNGDRKKIRD